MKKKEPTLPIRCIGDGKDRRVVIEDLIAVTGTTIEEEEVLATLSEKVKESISSSRKTVSVDSTEQAILWGLIAASRLTPHNDHQRQQAIDNLRRSLLANG